MKKTTRISRTIKCVFGKYRCKSGKRRIRNDWIFINEYSIVDDEEKYWCETHRKKVQNMVKQRGLKVERIQYLKVRDKEIILFNDEVRQMIDPSLTSSSSTSLNQSTMDILNSLNQELIDDFNKIQSLVYTTESYKNRPLLNQST